MIKKYFQKIILFILIITLSACGSTNIMSLNVTEPAPIRLSKNITKIGIIDRSLPNEDNKKIDEIDKILSLEGKNLDKDGAHQNVIGLYDELQKNNLFSGVKIIENPIIKNPGMGIIPSPLSWEKIQEIAAINNVNCVFELSFFDTDTSINYTIVPIQIEAPFGLKIPALEHHAKVNTSVKSGWRIYDLTNKIIVDEFSTNNNLTSNGVGINPLKAFEAILNRKEAVLTMCNNDGHEYALRLLPFRIRVSREYFVSGNENFITARRRAQTGNWDGAAELWNIDTGNHNNKIAGRACYNMAIINEINGNLDSAIDWASKSYSDYNNKLALHYLNILKQRKVKNLLLIQTQ